MAAPSNLQLDNQVCFPLYSASNAVVRAYRPYLDELNLTYLQYIVMMVLWEQGSLNVKQLGQRLKLDSGTLTPLLKRMQAKGLVVRKRSQSDERARIISLTEKGQALQEKARHIPDQLMCTLGLQKAELEAIKTLCVRVVAALEDNPGE